MCMDMGSTTLAGALSVSMGLPAVSCLWYSGWMPPEKE